MHKYLTSLAVLGTLSADDLAARHPAAPPHRATPLHHIGHPAAPIHCSAPLLHIGPSRRATGARCARSGGAASPAFTWLLRTERSLAGSRTRRQRPSRRLPAGRPQVKALLMYREHPPEKLMRAAKVTLPKTSAVMRYPFPFQTDVQRADRVLRLSARSRDREAREARDRETRGWVHVQKEAPVEAEREGAGGGGRTIWRPLLATAAVAGCAAAAGLVAVGGEGAAGALIARGLAALLW